MVRCFESVIFPLMAQRPTNEFVIFSLMAHHLGSFGLRALFCAASLALGAGKFAVYLGVDGMLAPCASLFCKTVILD